MRFLALLAAVMSHADHRHHHGSHGNPADLTDYIARLDDPARQEWQMPEKVLETLGVGAKTVVCDVGVGTGYFALRAAKLAKHVYGVEVEPKMLEVFRDRIAKSKLRNLTPVLALDTDPLLPAHACNIVLVVDTWHHFPDRVNYLKTLRGALAKGGVVAMIDWKPDDPSGIGPGPEHRIPAAAFLKDAKKAGLVKRAEYKYLPHQWFVTVGVE